MYLSLSLMDTVLSRLRYKKRRRRNPTCAVRFPSRRSLVGVIPLIGEVNALQRNEENQLRLDSMIQDMEKQFQAV